MELQDLSFYTSPTGQPINPEWTSGFTQADFDAPRASLPPMEPCAPAPDSVVYIPAPTYLQNPATVSGHLAAWQQISQNPDPAEQQRLLTQHLVPEAGGRTPHQMAQEYTALLVSRGGAYATYAAHMQSFLSAVTEDAPALIITEIATSLLASHVAGGTWEIIKEELLFQLGKCAPDTKFVDQAILTANQLPVFFAPSPLLHIGGAGVFCLNIFNCILSYTRPLWSPAITQFVHGAPPLDKKTHQSMLVAFQGFRPAKLRPFP